MTCVELKVCTCVIRVHVHFSRKSAILWHRNSTAPGYLTELLEVYEPTRQLRSSSDTSILCLPSVRTHWLGQRSFAAAAAAAAALSVCSSLPCTVSSSSTLTSLKSSLKSHRFRLSYGLSLSLSLSVCLSLFLCRSPALSHLLQSLLPSLSRPRLLYCHKNGVRSSTEEKEKETALSFNLNLRNLNWVNDLNYRETDLGEWFELLGRSREDLAFCWYVSAGT